MQNKKSQIEDLLSFLAAIVIIVFVVFFFPSRSIAGTKAVQEKINLQMISKDSEQLLISYLRTPLNNDVDVAEAVNTYFVSNDENLLNQIKTLAHEFFSKSYLETDSSSWSLEIRYPGKSSLIIEPEKARTNYILRKEISVVTIPTQFFDKQIELKMFLVQTKYVPK
ncbi:hypothetical protein HYT53_06010 [Candidatus Woesearchaeota archaeon]|nr:hypothetical protein [Candidatus Woesearchaeota archaeon]